MRFYDSDTHEIFEATAAEFKAARDDYQSQLHRDLWICGVAPQLFTLTGPVLKGHRHFVHKLDEEYTMIKFEDKYVHFRWSEELKGKQVFFADTILHLEQDVADTHEDCRAPCIGRGGDACPFAIQTDDKQIAPTNWQFVYYDPNYDCKVAFNEGQQIQCRQGDSWGDVAGVPIWYDDVEYRIKPAGLQWTDLEVGDVLEHIDGRHKKAMVTRIDYEDSNGLHIYAGEWLPDAGLSGWKKVSK